MATFTEVALSGDSLMSNAPVSGNLFECGPLFVDEYSILLCASGYVKTLYIQRDELPLRSSSWQFIIHHRWYYRSLIQAISSKTGELIGSFSGHSACVTCIKSCPLSFDSKDGGNEQANIAKASPLVVSTSIDGCIIVWNKVSFSSFLTIFFHANERHRLFNPSYNSANLFVIRKRLRKYHGLI